MTLKSATTGSNQRLQGTARTSPSVAELETLFLSTRGMARSPHRMGLLNQAIAKLSARELTEALHFFAGRGNNFACLILDKSVDPAERVSLQTFIGVVDHVVSDGVFSPTEREVVACLFARLPPEDRSRGLVAAAHRTAFDIRALKGVLAKGESVPYQAFEPFLTTQRLEEALALERGQGRLDELCALFNHLAPGDQQQVLAQIDRLVSPRASVRFGKLAAAEKAHRGPFLGRVFQALRDAFTRRDPGK